MTSDQLATICAQANIRYRRDHGTLGVGMLTTQLLRIVLQILRERGWQAPEGEKRDAQ